VYNKKSLNILGCIDIWHGISLGNLIKIIIINYMGSFTSTNVLHLNVWMYRVRGLVLVTFSLANACIWKRGWQ